jgi:hypothetical protein
MLGQKLIKAIAQNNRCYEMTFALCNFAPKRINIDGIHGGTFVSMKKKLQLMR